MSNNEQETPLKPMISFHDEICKFARGKLRPTETKISYADGRQFVKSSSSDEEREIVDQNETKLLVMNDDQTSSTYWTRFSGYVVQVNADLSIDEILPNFYLSGDDVALNRELLKTRNVSHIVNLTTNVPNKFESDNIIYQRIVIYDLPTESIAQHFKDTYVFIDEALNSGKSVLVHCNAGKTIASDHKFKRLF